MPPRHKFPHIPVFRKEAVRLAPSGRPVRESVAELGSAFAANGQFRNLFRHVLVIDMGQVPLESEATGALTGR
jgi:hypothetical protein